MFAPLINDITTTFPNPPEFVAIAQKEKSGKYNYKPEFYDQQKAYYKDLAPLVCPFDKATCFKICHEVAQDTGWKLVEVDESNARIEATATTLLMRYKDDVVIELREDNQQWSVHMRSKSRVGKGDLGANAKRIKAYFKSLKKRWAEAQNSKTSSN